MSELSTKIVKLDLDFILNHYLNRALWKKKWTIFKFDGYKITAHLYNLNFEDDKVSLLISLYSALGTRLDYEFVYLSTNDEHRNLKVLNQKLSGKVVMLIETLERSKIRQLDEYQDAIDAEHRAKAIIKERAEALLDELEITNDDIRQAYIDSQRSNSRIDYTSAVVSAYKYKILTSFYLTYLRYADYENKYNSILEEIDKPDYDPSELDEFINSMETGEFSESLQLDEI
jgi:hypothetical protein